MVDILLWSLALLASAVEVCQAEISTACYGTNPLCDYYSMQCPASQIIKLNNLYAGVKTQQFCGTNSSTDHCVYSAECCNYRTDDNVEHFNLENTYNAYTNCSGKQSCQNTQAPWQLMTSLLPNAVTSTYVQLEYGCELASSKVPLCGGTTGSVAGVYSTVEIMFDGSTENFDPLKASKECRCTVQNIGAQQNIVFKTIDVRLPSYHRDVNESVTVCSSAVFIASNVMVVRCVESMQHYQYNFYYNKTETLTLPEGLTSDISLMDIHQNGTYDSPAMVWLSLTAETGRNFQLTCKEVSPAKFTTTTTTTTTTTKTTTTTTSATTSTTTTTAASTTTTSTSATTNTTKQTTTNIITTTPKPTTTIITTMPISTKLTTSTITEPTTTSSITSTSITTSASNPTSPATQSSALTSAFTRTAQSARVPFTITVIDGDRRTVVILAIAFPITVGVLIIAAVIFWAVWKRRNHRQVRKGNTRLPENMKGVETEDRGTYEIIPYLEQGNAVTFGIIPNAESRPTEPSEISLNEESENTGPYEILPQLEQEGDTQPVNIPNVESRVTGNYEAILNVEQRNSRPYETILNSEQTQSNQHFPPEESKITRPYENIPTVEQRNARSYETNSHVKSEGTQRYKTVLNVDKRSARSFNTRNSGTNRNVEPRQAQPSEVEQVISLPYETLSSVELDNAGHYEIIQDENTIYSTNV